MPIAALNLSPGFSNPASLSTLLAPGRETLPEAESQRSVQAILSRRIDNALQTVAQVRPVSPVSPVSSVDDSDFAPANVANRILQAVETRINDAIASGASQQRLEGLLSQAREGISRGLQETRDILEGLDILNGVVAENLNDTERLLNQGLDALSNQFQQPTTGPAPSLSRSVAGIVGVSAFQQVLQARSESFDLQIQTRDGDTVTISLSASAASSRTSLLQGDSAASGFARREVSSAESRVSYSVAGQLDDDELQAIDALVSDVTRVADKFFAGNVQSAFNRALRLDFDADEIAGFALSLQQTQLTQVSSAYETVASLGNAAGPAAVVNPLQALADLVDTVDGVLRNDSLVSAADQLKGLFSALAESLSGDSDTLTRALELLVDELDGRRDTDAGRDRDDD